ncbi:hypothetical protein C922_03471, partial [Plasmodium inui San Antonio 1]
LIRQRITTNGKSTADSLNDNSPRHNPIATKEITKTKTPNKFSSKAQETPAYEDPTHPQNPEYYRKPKFTEPTGGSNKKNIKSSSSCSQNAMGL